MKMSVVAAIKMAIQEEMAADEKVICIGEDIDKKGGAWGYFKGLGDEFGYNRMLTMPISENAYSHFAVGAAYMNYRPICEIMFADFSTLAFEAIADVSAKVHFFSNGTSKAPIVWMLPQGAGSMSGVQHCQSVEGWYQNVPGLKIVAPTTPADYRAFLRASTEDDDPVVFIIQRALFGTKGEVPETLDEVPSLAHAGKVVKEGADLTVVAYQRALINCIEAAKEVEAETGKTIEIIDPRVLAPFDKECVFKSVKKTGRLMAAHEAPKTGGFSAQIVDCVVEEMGTELKANPVRVCGVNGIIPFGPPEKHLIPTKDDYKAGMLKALK